jgi:xanthine/CO dehydrogenase XdhC/CoxF family maturation factor
MTNSTKSNCHPITVTDSRYHQSMKRALAPEAGYIALIANRKRWHLMADYLPKEGIGGAALDRVMAPLGLDLGMRIPKRVPSV